MEVGSSEVVIRVNTGQLDKGLSVGEKHLARFDAAVNRMTAALESKFNRSAQGGAQAAKELAGSLSLASRIGSGIGTAIVAGVAAVGFALHQGVEAAERYEQATLKTQSALRATGHAAGLTAGEIRELSQQISDNSLSSTESVEKAARALITFGNTSGDEFKRTLTLAQDLAAATEGDLTSAVTKLGVAFERPEQAARRFRDIGLHEVVLLEAQALKDAGKEAEAHGVILDAIQKKVGGAGAAETGGLAGAYNNLSSAIGKFLTKVGDSGPLQVWTDFITNFGNGIKVITNDIFGATEAIKTGAKDGIVAQMAARKGAELSSDQRKKDDARAKQLKKEADDRKEAIQEEERERKRQARALEELNKQRAEAVQEITKEASLVEDLIPKLLASGAAEEDITKALQDEREILRELERLKLSRDSDEGKEIEEQTKKREALLNSLDKELSKRSLLRDAQQSLDKMADDTATINMTTQAAAKLTQQQALLNKAMNEGIPITGDLLGEIESLGDEFGNAAAAQASARFFKESSEGIARMSLELSAQRATMSMSTREAAAYNFEQERLYELAQLVENITPEQRAQIRALATEYGNIAEQVRQLEALQTSNYFLNGQLSSALGDIAFEGKQVGDAFADMGKSIAKAAMDALLFGQGPLAGLFGGGESGIGGGLFGKAISTGGNFLASILHEGGDGSNAPRRSVPIRTFAKAPRLHDGLMPGEFPAILENGEEVISKKDRSKGQGSSTYVWNVTTPDANSFMASKRQITQQWKRVLQ